MNKPSDPAWMQLLPKAKVVNPKLELKTHHEIIDEALGTFNSALYELVARCEEAANDDIVQAFPSVLDYVENLLVALDALEVFPFLEHSVQLGDEIEELFPLPPCPGCEGCDGLPSSEDLEEGGQG